MHVLMRRSMCSVCALVAAGWWLGPGCGSMWSGQPGRYHRLQSDDHDVRAAAVIEAARARDRRATPYLIDRLEDEEADIRLFAIQALRRITGEGFGYRFYAKEPARREAVQRWRQWLLAQSGAADGGAP